LTSTPPEHSITGYRRRPAMTNRKRIARIALLAGCVLLAALATLFIPSVRRWIMGPEWWERGPGRHCLQTLSQLCTALGTYAGRYNNGYFPPNLESVAFLIFPVPDQFRADAVKKARKSWRHGTEPEKDLIGKSAFPGYTYMGAGLKIGPATDGLWLILVCDDRPRHEKKGVKGRYVLFTNGEIVWYPEQQFYVLTLQNQNLRKFLMEQGLLEKKE